MTIDVRKVVTVNRAPGELYRFWRDFTNLPRFMSHLEKVEILGEKRSRWTAKAPLGQTVEWEAELTEEHENDRLSWRSTNGEAVEHSGSVRFVRLPANRGSEVHVTLGYDPPGGRVGALAAKLFGEEPEQQITDDLRRFKAVMEAGEFPSTKGQPSGRR
jgi:uncharacterized membrane protein